MPAEVVSLRTRTQTLLPGVLIAFTIAAASMFISEHYGAPVMLLALLIGIAFHFLNTDQRFAEGVKFTSTRLLKIGVACLGVRVTFGDIASLGPGPIATVPVLITLTIAVGVGLSKMLGRSVRFGVLTAGAVAICGASAALAIGSALPSCKAGERDTLFTVIAVTSLSTVAMILYPIAFGALGFSEGEIGFLIGATIHDVAQVVGAGFAVSEEAGVVATYVKLLRVAFLPVVVILIATLSRGGNNEAKAPLPWFAVGFAGLVVLNSLGAIPEFVAMVVRSISQWFLIGAIAALGMKTSFKEMAELGPGPISIVIAQTSFLCIAAMVAVSLL